MPSLRPPARSINPQRQRRGVDQHGNPAANQRGVKNLRRGGGRPHGSATLRTRQFANELARQNLAPLVRLHKIAEWQEGEWRRAVSLLDSARASRAKTTARLRADAREWSIVARETLSEMLPFCHPKLSRTFTSASGDHAKPLVVVGRDGETLEQALQRVSGEESQKLIEHHQQAAADSGERQIVWLEESDGI